MADEAGEDVGAVAEALEGAGDPVREPAEAGEAAVTEFDMFEVAPEVLDRVEVGRVAGEPFELEPGGRAGGEEVLDRLAAMCGQAISDDEQLAGDAAKQVLEEAYDASPVEGLRLGQRVDRAGLPVPSCARAPMTERWSRVSLPRKTGVRPRGAQVRTATGSS